DYYKQVKSPIDLTRIQQKLKTEEYLSFEEFCEDVELLMENTRTYYKDPLWKLYWTIRNAPNEKDRETNLSDPFLELPSRR
ncbi:hypothetical protein ANCCEY_14918, partial [Ancylostoma ceylanicum]